MKKYIYLFSFFLLLSCGPKKDIEFRRVLNVKIETEGNAPVINADIVFFNPNKTRSKLKQIEVDILVNEKKAGTVSQIMDQRIEGEAEFTVPIKVNLAVKEMGIFDTIMNIFGGKKSFVRIVGKIKVKVHGVGVTVPVDHKEEIKFKM
jgi:LEA14-like dessication related protein